MSNISLHWPEWRTEIASRRSSIERILSRPPTGIGTEKATLEALVTLLKAAFWLLQSEDNRAMDARTAETTP